MMELKEISFPDDTKYSFEEVKHPTKNYSWNIIANDGTVWPYNDGKFNQDDYVKSSTQSPTGYCTTSFWNWSQITRRERRAFRSYWIQRANGKPLSIQEFRKAKEVLMQVNVPYYDSKGNCYGIKTVNTSPSVFGDCKPASTLTEYTIPRLGYAYVSPKQEQGNNPMRYETTTANAVITAAKSDESIQREYLLEELEKNTRSWSDPVRSRLSDLFNINVDNTPKTAEQLIDAIQNGKFKLDDKKAAKAKAYIAGAYDPYDDDCDCDYPTGIFYGLTFDGPQPDPKGYNAAIEEYEKAIKDTKRAIIVKSPADGLDALTALESWQPTGKAN